MINNTKYCLLTTYFIEFIIRPFYTTTNCSPAASSASPNRGRGATASWRAPFFFPLVLMLVLLTSASGSGQTGATSWLPKLLATQSTTPFVHPKPAWTVYSPPLPALSTSLIENFSNIWKKTTVMSHRVKRWVWHRARGATHVSGVVDTLSDVQLLIGQFREQARNRPASCVPGTVPGDVRKADNGHIQHTCSPATQSARDISIRETSRKRIAPAFARRSIAAVEVRAVQRVDVSTASCARRVLPTPYLLTW